MDPLELVDDLYEEFAAGLGGDLEQHARDLPRALRLAPVQNARWSAVFTHEITLAAPALFVSALPEVPILVLREAVRAHMFAVIDAFGADRIEDRQAFLTADALHVLEAVRAERDASLTRLGRVAATSSPSVDVDPSATDRATAAALLRERQIILQGRPVDLPTYERISLAKQSAGVIVTRVLADALGVPAARSRAIELTLESVAMSLQLYDDVVDWEDDESRGGSWVVSLMRGLGLAPHRAAAPLREQVLGCDVLLRVLRRSRWHMRAAAARSRALGAERVAAWAAARAESLSAVVSAEARSAGYSIRSHALSAWATEVLA